MSEKNRHPDQKYIDGLLQSNSSVIQSIYDKFAPKVIHYICNNSGDKDQAKDIIQEVLVVIYKQARDKDLELTCPFDAYFFLLCKRRWLNELKKPHQKRVTILESVVSEDEAVEKQFFETDLFDQQEQLYTEMLEKIGNSCKELLKLSFQLPSMEAVAKQLDISYGYARKRKSLCIGKLTELIRQSPKFITLKNEA